MQSANKEALPHGGQLIMPANSIALYEQAVAEYQRGELATALGLFRRYTEAVPDDPRGWVAVGVILEAGDEIEEAITAYSVAVELSDDAESHVKLGKTLARLRFQGRADDEQRHYRRALEIDPANAEAWSQLSDLQRDLGDSDAAIVSAQEAVRLAPRSFGSHYKLGLAYFFAGDDAAADAALTESNRLAIAKWNTALDGRPRRWFARPQRVRGLLDDHCGRIYGQRVPKTGGPCCWQLPSLLYQHQQAYLVQHSDIYLEGLHGLVYDDRQLYATQHVKIQGVWRFFVESKPEHPRETLSVAKIAALHQPDCTNYYHWMAECLTRLVLLEDLLERDAEISVLVPRGTAPYISQTLDLIGLAEERRIVNRAGRSRRYFAEQLYYVDWQWPLAFAPAAELAATWYPPRAGLVRLRDRLTGPSLPTEERRLVVYVRRGPHEVRHVQGDEQLIQRLSERYGAEFVVFAGEELSVAEQIELFRRARVVLGPHGAGMTNLLFSPPGTGVIEFPIVPAVLNHFAHLAMALEHDYWVTPFLTASYQGSYSLDSDAAREVCRLVEQLYCC